MSATATQRVVVVGASDKPDRFAHKALTLLSHYRHEVVPVHPRLKEIKGMAVVADLSDITGVVDTVTMYVGPAISADLADKLIFLKPRRVIFNPGAENAGLATKLEAAGISTEDACTLVLLHTRQF